MPLPNLFQKRSSQKNKKTKPPSNETETQTSAKLETIPATETDVAEVSGILQEMVITVSEKSDVMEKKGTILPDSVSSEESSKINSPVQSSGSAENTEIDPIPKQEADSKSIKQKKRSFSVSHSDESVKTKQKDRRKFGSEGEVLSIANKIFPPKQKKELDEVIGRYVDKLIRDSIVKAVKNVNVDSLYEEIVKDFSNRSSSESAESVENFVVEQRLSSHSISELVELEASEDEEREKDSKDFTLQDYNSKFSENECTEQEYDSADHASLMGYLADYEDTTSVDDVKYTEEDSSVCSTSDRFEGQFITNIDNGIMTEESDEDLTKNPEKISEEIIVKYSTTSATEKENNVILPDSSKVDAEHTSLSTCQQNIASPESNLEQEKSFSKKSTGELDQKLLPAENVGEQDIKCPSSKVTCNQKSLLENTHTKEKKLPSAESTLKQQQNLPQVKNVNKEQNLLITDTAGDQDQLLSSNSTGEHNQKFLTTDSTELSSAKSCSEQAQKCTEPKHTIKEQDLIVMSPENESLLTANESKEEESVKPPPDIDENLPQQPSSVEEEKKVNWKAGYLHVKLPHKSRSKTHLKAWKKRCVAIQPDEFVNDPKNPSLVISVYGAESGKHGASFWQTVSSLKAVVYRSSSRTHPYAFTISDEGRAIIHLSAESETMTQEWMAAVRAVLWPPSPFMQLEKMLSGREFEISLIDNEFSYHAGLLGMYGYLTITPRKLILLHPQEGYVIQEWYLNTVDKFQLVPQSKAEDSHKILAMTTCSDSSTGSGKILLFCNEAVTLLQSLASTIHQVLTYHNKQEGGKYQKEMEEMAEWLVAPTQDSLSSEAKSEEHYKMPTRQVKSLLDIPNFIFKKSLSPVASAIYPAPPNAGIVESLEAARAKPVSTSHDSGISTCNSSDDFLNCSVTSFVLGGGPLTGKSSDSELSDTYTPPRSPVALKKIQTQKSKESISPVPEISS